MKRLFIFIIVLSLTFVSSASAFNFTIYGDTVFDKISFDDSGYNKTPINLKYLVQQESRLFKAGLNYEKGSISRSQLQVNTGYKNDNGVKGFKMRMYKRWNGGSFVGIEDSFFNSLNSIHNVHLFAGYGLLDLILIQGAMDSNQNVRMGFFSAFFSENMIGFGAGKNPYSWDRTYIFSGNISGRYNSEKRLSYLVYVVEDKNGFSKGRLRMGNLPSFSASQYGLDSKKEDVNNLSLIKDISIKKSADNMIARDYLSSIRGSIALDIYYTPSLIRANVAVSCGKIGLFGNVILAPAYERGDMEKAYVNIILQPIDGLNIIIQGVTNYTTKLFEQNIFFEYELL